MTHGLIVRDSAEQEILNISSRKPRFILAGTTGSIAAAATLDVTVAGMLDNDTWQVVAEGMNSSDTFFGGSMQVTKHAGYFRIENTSGEAIVVNYWVLKT